jgi:hypothetical protein
MIIFDFIIFTPFPPKKDFQIFGILLFNMLLLIGTFIYPNLLFCHSNNSNMNEGFDLIKFPVF